MLKALLWKEWREQRAIAAVGFGLSVLTPVLLTAWVLGNTGARDLWVAAETAAFINAAVVWPLLAAIVGATTGGDELASGTLRFLMSRPVSREQIWLTKSVTGALSVIAIAGFSFAVSALFSPLAGAGTLRFPFNTGPPVSAGFPDSLLRVYVVGVVVLAYATAVFFAAFVARPLASAMLGLASAIGVCSIIVTIQGAVAYRPSDLDGAESFAAASLALASAIVLGAGLLLYRRGNAGVSERAWRGAAGIGAACLLTVVGSTALVGAATTRIDPRHSAVRFVASVPGADTTILQAQGEDWVGRQYFALDASGSFRPLTSRMSVAGELSADGRWFAYVTGIGAGGLRGRGCGLRVVRLDGGGDRELTRFALTRAGSGGCTGWSMRLGGMKFSPGASRLAVVADGTLFVIDTDGGAPRRRVMGADDLRDGAGRLSNVEEARLRESFSVSGWSSDGRSVVVQNSAVVAAVDADSGVVARRFRAPEGDRLGVESSRGGVVVVSHWRVTERTDDGDPIYEERLLVFDPDSGRVAEIISAPVDMWLSSWVGAAEVIYLLGPDEEPEEGRGRFRALHRFDVATGADREIARFADSTFLFMSADESVFLVASWDRSIPTESNVWRVAVFGKGAPQRFDLPPGWRIDGWVGADHLVVHRDLFRRPRGERVYELAIADLNGDLAVVTRREY